MIRNARIDSTWLGREDHGIFTFSLGLDFGDFHQGYGQYALDGPAEPRGGARVGTAFGCAAIMGVLDVLQVPKWEALVGTPVRVRYEDHAPQAIGHFIENRWLDLKALGDVHREPVDDAEVGR